MTKTGEWGKGDDGRMLAALTEGGWELEWQVGVLAVLSCCSVVGREERVGVMVWLAAGCSAGPDACVAMSGAGSVQRCG